MGKTVKSRALISISSFVVCLIFCFIANNKVPQLYESYKLRVVAQQAASQSEEEVKKEEQKKQQEQAQPEENTEPEEAPAEPVEEEANVYDIPDEEPAVEEEPVEEEPEEEEEEEDFEDFDFDFGDEENQEKEEDNSDGGFLAMIINFFTGLIQKIKDFDLLGKIKDFFGGIDDLFKFKK